MGRIWDGIKKGFRTVMRIGSPLLGIAAPLANFIPGVGPAVSAGLGAASAITGALGG